MALSLLFLPILLAQEKPAAAPVAEKPAAAVAPAATDGPVLKAGGPELKPTTKGPAGKEVVPVQPPAADSSLGMFVYLAPVILLFYFMILRPQRRQEAKLRDLLKNVKKGDKVLMSSGMFGTVVSADPTSEKVVVRVDDDKGVKITFSKASITRVIDPQVEKAPETPA